MKTTKIKALSLAMLIGLSIFTISAQQTRSVGDFNGIKVGDVFNVVISQSELNTLSISGNEKDLSQIKTVVESGVLTITGDVTNAKDLVINIGAKSLNAIEATGSAVIKTNNKLICDKISIASNGAGDVTIDLKANEIKTKISGGGDITLKGDAKNLDASVTGAGTLKANNLEVEKATVKVSGAGDAKVNVSQSIDADVSGAGSIIYKGKPTERNINISGAGSVRESKSGNGEETANDTTNLMLGKKKLIIIDNENDDDSKEKVTPDFKHWVGWEIGVNGLLNYKNTLDMPNGGEFMELNYPKSIQFGLNMIEKDFHIYKNYVNLVTGFGFDFYHYALRNPVTLDGGASVLSATTDSTLKYSKNSLNVSYIKIPLMIEFNTSKNSENNLHIAVGGEFEYRIHSVQKQKYEVNDHQNKIKQRDDFNLAPFVYNATARVGYNNITVFANYGLSRLFQKDKGPQVYPFTIGVNFHI